MSKRVANICFKMSKIEKMGDRQIPKIRLINYWKSWIWDQYLPKTWNGILVNLWNQETLKPRSQEANNPSNILPSCFVETSPVCAKQLPRILGVIACVLVDTRGNTRVPQVRSCPPRRWSRAGVGVGSRYVWGVLGFSVSVFFGFLVSSWFLLGILVSWFLGFLVFSFLGFLVSWCLGFSVAWFLVSWFLVFLVSWFSASWFLGLWFLGFLVSNILGFLVSKILCLLVSKFLGFKVSWFQTF